MVEPESSNTRPIWFETTTIAKQPQQTGQISVDVCVIGGGITGLTAAHLLKHSGKTVAVVELRRIGSGETSHTTGHLTEVFDLDYRNLISKFGLEGARLASQSARSAINHISNNVAALNIDCAFKRVIGYKFTEKTSEVKEIEDEAAAATRAGVLGQLIFQAPLPFSTTRAIRFDNQAQFNPLPYLQSLARDISGQGSYIFEETRMIDVEEGEPCRVMTDRGQIIADEVFVAANVPSTNRFYLHSKIAAYRTYAIAAPIPEHFDLQHLYWDLCKPYHYMRTFAVNGSNYLIVGGEDHKTGQDIHTEQHFKKLHDWAKERFSIDDTSHRWSGQIIESVDGLPFIGRNSHSDHVFVATGFSGTGLTFGTIAGMIVSDFIIGNQNPWAELYAAERVKPLAAMKNFLTENIDFPSHLIGDRLTRAQSSQPGRLRENEGAILRIGAKKVAAYRDPQGEMHYLSPVCPHLGCYVGWNEAEKSWDCPCHGSRFSPLGQLINGPSVDDLASEEIDENIPMNPERYEPPSQFLDPFGAPISSVFSCPLKYAPKAQS